MQDSEREELVQALSDLFITGAAGITNRLADANETESRKNILHTEKSRDESFLAKWTHSDSTVEAALRDCAARIIKLSNTLPFYVREDKGLASLPIIELDKQTSNELRYSEDPVEWVMAYILRPLLLWHFKRLTKVSHAQKRDSNIFAKEVVELSLATTHRYIIKVSMIGLRTRKSDSIIVSNGESSLKIENKSKSSHGGPSTSLMTIYENKYRYKEFPIDEARSELNLLLLALQLHGFHADCQGEASLYLKQGEMYWENVDMVREQMLIESEHYSISQSQLKEIAISFQSLRERGYDLAVPTSSAGLSFRHFALGMSREDYADAFLDFMIALEALLLPSNDYQGEISYRFRLHGALYLEQEPQKRTEVYKTLKKLYETRSRLVHADKRNGYPTEDELENSCSIVKEFARKGLLIALQNEFPTANFFLKLLLGVSEE